MADLAEKPDRVLAVVNAELNAIFGARRERAYLAQQGLMMYVISLTRSSDAPRASYVKLSNTSVSSAKTSSPRAWHV